MAKLRYALHLWRVDGKKYTQISPRYLARWGPDGEIRRTGM
jgi:hypothetical protein